MLQVAAADVVCYSMRSLPSLSNDITTFTRLLTFFSCKFIFEWNTPDLYWADFDNRKYTHFGNNW